MELCFYHPVGCHSGERLEEIVYRKKIDIEKYGYTLWSFAKVNPIRANKWKSLLLNNFQEECDVICCGNNTKDPLTSGEPYWIKEYSTDLINWEKVPDKMTSYQRFPKDNKPVASAFIVDKIELGNKMIEKPKSWFMMKEDRWEEEQSIPTRGEFLIKYPDDGFSRLVKLILKIHYPFLTWLR